MGFEQVFDNLSLKHMDVLRKHIHSLVDYVWNYCFWTNAMLSKFGYDRKDSSTLEVLVGFSDINERYDIGSASFMSVFELFLHFKESGGLWFQLSHTFYL